MPPIIQQAITGLSDCFLIFSIGTFHTTFLRHPVDCAEVICFWTLQYFHYIIVNATSSCWQWRPPAAAAMGVCGGCATPPLLGGGGALATPPPSAAPPPAHPMPAGEAADDIATLPPASAGVQGLRAGLDRRILSGSAALCAELEQ